MPCRNRPANTLISCTRNTATKMATGQRFDILSTGSRSCFRAAPCATVTSALCMEGSLSVGCDKNVGGLADPPDVGMRQCGANMLSMQAGP